MRNVRPSPKRNEDGAIKSFVESPDGTSQSQEKRNGSPSGWKIPCTKLKNALVRTLLGADFYITDRRYIGFETDTGYHHYAIDVAKIYDLEV